MRTLKKIVKKPWGQFYDFAENKGKWHLKILAIKKGKQLSLQKHSKRSEFWIVAEGRVQITKGDKKFILSSQKTISISKNELHRIKAITDATVIEVSFGLHDEKDIIRVADDYGRVLAAFKIK